MCLYECFLRRKLPYDLWRRYSRSNKQKLHKLGCFFSLYLSPISILILLYFSIQITKHSPASYISLIPLSHISSYINEMSSYRFKYLIQVTQVRVRIKKQPTKKTWPHHKEVRVSESHFTQYQLCDDLTRFKSYSCLPPIGSPGGRRRDAECVQHHHLHPPHSSLQILLSSL